MEVGQRVNENAEVENDENRENFKAEITTSETTVAGNDIRAEEDREIIKNIIDIMRSEENEFIPGFKKEERRKLVNLCNKVNEIVSDFRTETITETNNLLNSNSIFGARKVGLKKPSSSKTKNKDPWWKRRLNASINEIRNHINILERKQRGEKVSKRNCVGVGRKYKVRTKGLRCVLEELKQRLKAKAFKLKRYEQTSSELINFFNKIRKSGSGAEW